MQVKLTWSEMQFVAHVGAGRRLLGMSERRSEPYGTPASANGSASDLWGGDIESCAAEYVVAKVTGLFWHCELRRDLTVAPPDVGDDLQVRHTLHEGGHLPVYDGDPDAHTYFLVIGKMPVMRVAGWIPGPEAKADTFRRKTPRGTDAFWIPQGALNGVEDFREWYGNPVSRREAVTAQA